MYIFRRSARRGFSVRFFRFAGWLLLGAFLSAGPIMAAADDESPANVQGSGTINVTVGAFSGGVSKATLTLTATDGKGDALTTGSVEWKITRIVSNTNQAVTTDFLYSLAGLSLGEDAWLLPAFALDRQPRASTVPAPVPVSKDISQPVTLSDTVGERVVEVSASITIDGSAQTFTGTVSFGEGPLSVFRLPADAGGTVGRADWADKANLSEATLLPAANMCGANPHWTTFRTWTAGDYSSQTNLPTRAELRAVADISGNGARLAAGWRSVYYWTGELRDFQGSHLAYSVYVESTRNDNVDWDMFLAGRAVVCRR